MTPYSDVPGSGMDGLLIIFLIIISFKIIIKMYHSIINIHYGSLIYFVPSIIIPILWFSNLKELRATGYIVIIFVIALLSEIYLLKEGSKRYDEFDYISKLPMHFTHSDDIIGNYVNIECPECGEKINVSSKNDSINRCKNCNYTFTHSIIRK